MSRYSNFRANEHKPLDSFDPIPSGNYLAEIISVTTKPTKDPSNDNEYDEFAFRILDGEYKGRQVWTRLNLKNNNPDTQEYAYRELTSIYQALGINEVQRVEDLYDSPLVIRVSVKAGNGGFGPSNEVKEYMVA